MARKLERIVLETEELQELRQLHVARYEFACDFVKDKIVLDAACGTGYGSAMISKSGAKRVIGFDVSDEALGYAREHYREASLSFILGDVQKLSFANEMDIVVSFETIEHLPIPEALLEGVVTALKPDGRFLISTPIRQKGQLEDKPTNTFHCREWNEAEFSELLKRFFNNIEFQYQFNFRKLWYPYSRSLSKVAAKVFYPSQTEDFLRYRVRAAKNILRGIPTVREYIIAACSLPIKKTV
jgi:SAM-dependent methyltransferase